MAQITDDYIFAEYHKRFGRLPFDVRKAMLAALRTVHECMLPGPTKPEPEAPLLEQEDEPPSRGTHA